MIWDYETGTCVKSFELSDLPVRCAKFIARKQWFVAASDDMRVRIYNYNTMEKVKEIEAHADYIRCIEVHPTLPYILSSSDDMSVKLWDWNKDFECTQYFEGHQHYVMQVKFNPKDTTTFATASLDRTVKVWGLGSPVAHYTLEGHERGVNCVDYYPSGDKPYILSGADDKTVKIWDYQVSLCAITVFFARTIIDVVLFFLTCVRVNKTISPLLDQFYFRPNRLCTPSKGILTMYVQCFSIPNSLLLLPHQRTEPFVYGLAPLIVQSPPSTTVWNVHGLLPPQKNQTCLHAVLTRVALS